MLLSDGTALVSFRSRILCGIFISIGIHLVFVTVTSHFRIARRDHYRSAPVKIKLIAEAKAPAAVSQADHPSKKQARAHQNSIPDSDPVVDPKSKSLGETTTRYADLLPKTGGASVVDSPSVGTAEKSDKFEAEPTTKIEMGRKYGLLGDRLSPDEDFNVDAFASKLMLPALWRDNAKDSRAVAYIGIDDEKALWLRSLSGDPLLRAVLYKRLHTSEFQRVLMKAMDAHRQTDYKIILRFVSTTDSYRGVNSEAAAFTDGVVITKRLPPAMRQFSGAPVEDEETRRAKQREQQEIRKLMDSPAFAMSIDQERLANSTETGKW